MEKKRKTGIPDTLKELFAGILAALLLFQATIVWLVRDRLSYSLGLWIGVALAEAGAVHMWWSLDRGMEQAAKQAAKTVGANNLIRYFVLVVVMFVLIYTDFANPIFMFCGYMGMKISAYLNPWLHKISVRLFKL